MSMRAALLTGYLQTVPSFDWRAANCCHFVAGWMRLNGLSDPMSGLPVTPDLLSTRRLLKTMGGTLLSAWTQQLGREPIPATLAQVGDIVHMKDGDTEAVGICAGRQAVFVLESGGFLFEPMSKASCAWRLA